MKHKFTLKQNVRFSDFLLMDDLQFFDTYIAPLPADAQIRFLQETPDFLSDEIGTSDSIDLETDSIYQKLIRRIHDMEHSPISSKGEPEI